MQKKNRAHDYIIYYYYYRCSDEADSGGPCVYIHHIYLYKRTLYYRGRRRRSKLQHQHYTVYTLGRVSGFWRELNTTRKNV